MRFHTFASDRPQFNTAPDDQNNVDAIANYNVAVKPIHFDNAVFAALTSTGGLAASAFKRIADAPKGASDRTIYNSDTGALYYNREAFGNVRLAVLMGAAR